MDEDFGLLNRLIEFWFMLRGGRAIKKEKRKKKGGSVN
jgi:hypothetical protein